MKKSIFFLITTLLFSCSLFSQNLKVALNYASYCTDALEPYIEFTFIVDGSSTRYVLNENKEYEAEVEIKVFIKDSSELIIDSLHYILGSSAYADSLPGNKPDFADIVNMKIPNGNYFLYFSINDPNTNQSPAEYIDYIKIYFPEERVSVSGIKLLRSISVATEDDFFVKSGFATPPLPDNFLPKNSIFLPFYMEVYNSRNVFKEDSLFFVRYSIESPNQWISFPEYTRVGSYEPAPVNIVIHQFNLVNLPSGNYFVVVDVLAPDSTVVATTRVFFQRSNPDLQIDVANFDDVAISNSFVTQIKDLATLQEYVASLYPIATMAEKDFFNKRMKVIPFDQLQRFFYSFWVKRNPNDPEGSWLEYLNKVKYVQSAYGSKLVKGYRTDRGRVYLQYGPPNSIKDAPYSPTLHPYQVWHYYHVDGQSNVRFIFYNEDLVTNNYELLHSDKTGELSDPAWQMKLVKGHHPVEDFDIKKPDNFWGNDMDENWRNP